MFELAFFSAIPLGMYVHDWGLPNFVLDIHKPAACLCPELSRWLVMFELALLFAFFCECLRCTQTPAVTTPLCFFPETGAQRWSKAIS